MYIGHVGAALAAKRVRGSIGLLVLLVATYAPDWVDMGMCVGGAYNPAGILSHSIPAVLTLMLVGFTGYGAVTRDWTGALVIAALQLSRRGFFRRGNRDRGRRVALCTNASSSPPPMG